MRKIGKKKLIVAGVATAVIAAGAGTALAYWTSTGSGTGTASTGSSSAFEVVLDSPVGAALSPGGPVDSVAFHVTNHNTGAQNFANAVATVTGTDKAGCSATNYQISGLTAGYGNLVSGATADGSFDLQMVDSGSNQDACQGATVSLKVDVS